jgi:hypothetical protein
VSAFLFCVALILAAIRPALLVARLTGLLLVAGILAVAPTVIASLHALGIRVCDRRHHHARAGKNRQGSQELYPLFHFQLPVRPRRTLREPMFVLTHRPRNGT